jgi:hypothetical protein
MDTVGNTISTGSPSQRRERTLVRTPFNKTDVIAG